MWAQKQAICLFKKGVTVQVDGKAGKKNTIRTWLIKFDMYRDQ